jgi:hypothetical protein
MIIRIAATTLMHFAVGLRNIQIHAPMLSRMLKKMYACVLVIRLAAKGLNFVRSTFASMSLSTQSLITQPALRKVTAPMKNRI